MNWKAPMLVAALVAVAGCTLNRSEQQRESLLSKIGGNSGQIIEPKRCTLQVAILSRPLNDKGINAELWSVVDEQIIAPELRKGLQANGIRIGLITGELPGEVDELLNAPPPNKVEPSQFEFPNGDFAMIDLAARTPEVSLLLNRDGHAFGKPYKDASGRFRVTASHEGTHGVSLRFVPEIHHGPIQRSFGTTPYTGTYMPQEFVQKDSQQEESLRELATTLILQPGQVAVLGCLPEAKESLGAFMFTKAEPNSDRLLQQVLLVWATRQSLTQATSLEGGDLPTLTPVEPPSELTSP